MINREGKEISRLVAADADAIGYLYRKENKAILSFAGGGDFIAEARPKHLRGKEIVLTELQDDDTIVAHWDKIYLPEANTNN